MRILFQMWLAPFAAHRIGKTSSFLKEILPLQRSLKHGRNRKVSKTLMKRCFLGVVALSMEEAVRKGYSYGKGSSFFSAKLRGTDNVEHSVCKQ